MRNHSQSTLISIVRAAVSEWRRREDWSRETVAHEIVVKHEEIGGPATTGLIFDPNTRDTYSRMKVNSDRIFRWLDDETKDCTLLPANFLPSILAALPSDLQLQCISQILRPLGLEVRSSDDQAAPAFNPSANASTIAKESTEAVVRLLSLDKEPSQSDVDQTCKELDDVAEAVCAVKRSLRSTSIH